MLQLARRSRAAAPAGMAGAGLTGLEHEYYLFANGRPADFRRLIHLLPIDGRRLDPGDANAYRLRSGLALTCDNAEAEIATPPLPVRRGFAAELAACAVAGEATLRALLPGAYSIEGASTHLSVSVPDDMMDAVCALFVRCFAAPFMLLGERPDSHGVMVRPRPGRIELCCEYVAGEALRQVALFAVASVHACMAAVSAGESLEPLALDGTFEAAIERAGVVVRRRAFGPDLYEQGRAAILRQRAGGRISVGEHLAAAWRTVRPWAANLASRSELASLDELIEGSIPLPRPPAPHAAARARPRPAKSPFGELIAPPAVGGDLWPRAATWEFTLFDFTGPGGVDYICVPRDALPGFLAMARAGRLDPHALPSGRRLECHCQTKVLSCWSEVAPVAQLLDEERQSLGGSGLAELLADPALATAAAPGKGPGRTPGPPPTETPPPPPPPTPPTETPPPPSGGTPPPPPPPPPVAPPPWQGGTRLYKTIIPGIPVREEHHRHEIPTTSTSTEPGTPPRESHTLRRLGLIGGSIVALITSVVVVVVTLTGGGGASGENPSPSPTTGQPVTSTTGIGGGVTTPQNSSPGAASPGPSTSPAQASATTPANGTVPATASTPGSVTTPTSPGGAVPSPSPSSPANTSPTATSTTASAPTPTPPPTATPTTPPAVLSGTRTLTFAVQSNPAGHPCVVGPTLPVNFLIQRDRSVEPNPVTITVTAGGLPVLTGSTVIGSSFGSEGGKVVVSGTGSYCQRTTSFDMSITISPTSVSGTLVIGGDGALPSGQPIIFSYTGGAPGS